MGQFSPSVQQPSHRFTNKAMFPIESALHLSFLNTDRSPWKILNVQQTQKYFRETLFYFTDTVKKKQTSYGKLKKIKYLGFFSLQICCQKKYNSAGEINCIQFKIISFITWIFLETINKLSLFCSFQDQEHLFVLVPLTSFQESEPWLFFKAGHLLQILTYLT